MFQYSRRVWRRRADFGRFRQALISVAVPGMCRHASSACHPVPCCKRDRTPIFATDPCAFQDKAKSGGWTRGGPCGAEASGVDGDGSFSEVPGGDLITRAGEACLLADSGPRRSVDPEDQPLSRDRETGLVLIADPALWTGSEQRFRCDLRISR